MSVKQKTVTFNISHDDEFQLHKAVDEAQQNGTLKLNDFVKTKLAEHLKVSYSTKQSGRPKK